MAKPLQSSSGQVLVMDLPNDAAAREVADKLAEQQSGRTIIVTDENGNEIYVAKIRPN